MLPQVEVKGYVQARMQIASQIRETNNLRCPSANKGIERDACCARAPHAGRYV